MHFDINYAMMMENDQAKEKETEMIKSNFHTHTRRCGHAQGSGEDYVKAALSSGFSRLGFSDHGPYPDVDYGLRMPFDELKDYLEEVDDLAVKYRDEIVIRKGLEIEYLPKYRSYYEELLTKWGVEYLLMGEHFYIDTEGEQANIYETASSTEQYIAYAGTVVEGMHTGFFKAVAHPDIYLLNPFAWNDDCKRAADMIIDAAVATDTILEYNSNGLRWEKRMYPDGVRPPYPHDTFWQMAAGAPVRVIVGSDCHNPACLWDEAVARSYENLKKIGIEPIEEL